MMLLFKVTLHITFLTKALLAPVHCTGVGLFLRMASQMIEKVVPSYKWMSLAAFESAYHDRISSLCDRVIKYLDQKLFIQWHKYFPALSLKSREIKIKATYFFYEILRLCIVFFLT
jgi:hypothetical protein